MLSPSDRSFLYTYLAHTIESGLHPKDALAAYISDVSLPLKRKEELKRALFLFTKKSSLGTALRDARVIPEEEARILIFAKQKTMPYAPSLASLGAHLRSRALIKKKVRALLVYPAILVLELTILGSIMLLWLIPQLEMLFIKLGMNEPRLVRLLGSAGKTIDGFLTPANLPFLLVIPTIIFAIIMATRRPRVRRAISATILHAPLIGPLYRLLESEKIFGMLAVAVNSTASRDSYEAFTVVAECVQNPLYAPMLSDLSRAIKETSPLAQVLHQRKNRHLLTVIARRMLILGEKRGDIPAAIAGTARILSEELDIEMRRFTSLLEPLLVVSIATIVGGIGLTIQRVFAAMQGAVIGG